MDSGLGQHGVVLKLGLPERRSVAGDDDELGLARAEGLKGRLVAESDCNRLSYCVCEHMFKSPAYPFRT